MKDPVRLNVHPCLFRISGRQNTQRSGCGASNKLKVTQPKIFEGKIMRRFGNLWDEFVSKENWDKAVKNALKGKKTLHSVRRFLAKGEGYSEELRQQIIDGTFEFKGYNTKLLYEPKLRKLYISRLEERFFHWACMIIVERIFEPTFIFDSYSCRKKKGQHLCSRRCMEFVRKNDYCLKMDISKFYPSINQENLKKCLRKKIKDEKFLSEVFKIIDSYHPDGVQRGVPIGNYSSQIFGNIYMTQLDNFVKQELKCRSYLRYCDDFILFSNDKKYLNECKHKMIAFVHDVLDMKLSKCELFPVKRGVDFVGYRHFKEFILIRKTTAQRVKRRMRTLEACVAKGKVTAKQALGKIASAIGWTKHANAYHFVKKIRLFELKEKFQNAKV